jgi:hypothetical protein
MKMKESGINSAPRHSSGTRRDGQNLTAFVETAGRTNPVRHIRLRALGTGADLRQFKHAVISAAHTLPAPRWFTLWNAHNSINLTKF